jgi:hypothetical protein
MPILPKEYGAVFDNIHTYIHKYIDTQLFLTYKDSKYKKEAKQFFLSKFYKAVIIKNELLPLVTYVLSN